MTQVFSAEWFDEHQAALLRFANTRAGRRTLRIHGLRSAVGSRRIICIQPHAITWDNEDGTYSTEFRTHPKFAQRLYYAFKPLWWTMHGWDMAIANRVAPKLNAGFDTLTARPEAGSGDVTVDGYVYRSASSDESLATIRSGAGSVADISDGIVAGIESGQNGGFVVLQRGIMTFNTSAIDPLSTVESATLSLWLNDYQNLLGDTPVHITSAAPAKDNNLLPADYGTLGSTSFASASRSAMSFSAYYGFALNSSGLANINRGGISGFGLRLEWDLLNSFPGPWSSYNFTYYSFQDADNGGTVEGPKLVVTYTAVDRAAATGTLELSGTVAPKTTHYGGASGTLELSGSVSATKNVAPVSGKQWMYRIYDQNNNYIGIWKDDIAPPDFTQQINTPGTTLDVKLPRNAFTTKAGIDDFSTDDGNIVTTDDGYNIGVIYTTRNTVGPNTDVDVNYFVDVYAFYGGYDTIETDAGQTIATDGGDDILIPVGAPLGTRIFSGFILDYEADYADQDMLVVSLMSNGMWELGNQIIQQGATTTVAYNADIGGIVASLVAMNSGGKTAYSNTSIWSTGTTANPSFQLNTLTEGITDMFSVAPSGWYWYGNPADNLVYFQQAGATAKHTFILGKHIGSLKFKKTLEQLANDIRFVGGDTGGSVYLYDKFTTGSSVNRTGLLRPTDRRIKTTAEAQLFATKYFARYKDPIYAGTLVIPAEDDQGHGYDIESIQLGDTFTFANFGNFIDGLLLMVTSRHYTGYTVELEFGEILPSQAQIIAGINTELQRSTFQTIPTSPASTIVI